MRPESEIFQLVVGFAEKDARIRGVVLNGSRVNPSVKPDRFQDYDVIYLVQEIDTFTTDHSWIRRFGELMILQMPEAMGDISKNAGTRFAYLMQFVDGSRIDLTLVTTEFYVNSPKDSLSRVLLDKDNIIGELPPPNELDYLPQPPTDKEFFDSCNEFWWMVPYVAKGLKREQVTYAKSMLERGPRAELMRMLEWYAGTRTDFKENIGYCGKNLQKWVEPEVWAEILKTYCGADLESNWQCLFCICNLFRKVSAVVGSHFGLSYPQGDDQRVTAYLRSLSGDSGNESSPR